MRKTLRKPRNKSKKNIQTRRRQRGGALCPANPDPRDIYTRSTNPVGSGTWYIYEDQEHPSILIKESGGVNWRTEDEMEREVRISVKAGDLGLAPKILYYTICKNDKNPTLFMVMERIYGTPIDEDNQEQIAEVNKLLRILNDNKILHMDLSLNNAMWGTTASHPSPPRAWLIDFEISKEVDIPPKRYEELTV